MKAFLDYLERCGVEFNVAVNVMTGGELGQTVSHRVATAAQEGRRIGCLLCWFLDWAVQREHRGRQLGHTPAGWRAYLRATAAFTVGGLAVLGIGHAAVNVVELLVL